MFKRLIARADNFLYRVVLKNILKLSKLGYGFIVSGAEAGTNYERIYNNKPEGAFMVGRYIDEILLKLPSVVATRERKDDIKKILSNEIANNYIAKRKTKILDLASGGARYLRELKAEHESGSVESLCIDKDQRCVSLGRSLSQQENIKNLRFFRADIFRTKHLKVISQKMHWIPNIVIASGFFIYLNDQKVRNVLEEIYKILPNEGLLLFQSYERLSSRKLMRKTAVTSSGEQWTLYYRQPEFWRKLLCGIGFKYIFITRDKWEMNNICFARKVS